MPPRRPRLSSFLSARAACHIDKNSLAREISTLRNFFKWLNRSKILKNEDISVIVNPRRPKILPKALDVTQIFNLLKNPKKSRLARA
ncbi:MAG: site-specific integrase [Alphaproteobacteria bacterium]